MSTKTFLLFVLILLVGITVTAQKTVKVYGIISDAKTGELLQAATIKNNSDILGSAISNLYGFYSMYVQADTALNIQVSFVGYQTQQFFLNISNDTILDIKLIPGVELEEFTVSASETSNRQMAKIGQLTLTSKAIKFAPSLAGESNVMMALKTLPGVSAGKEGSSELFVRGGSHDQNLILLDKSPVYNLNHAFGLLSVFNSSALKNVSMYKGGIPSEYGGRLSSVLDVSVKEGNRKYYSGDVTISTIAATGTIEGPIIKNKASFLVSARRSWPDILVSGISKSNQSDMSIGYYFMDINAKTNFSVNKKHHFYLSYYTGKDKLFAKNNAEQQKNEMNQGWGNSIASARYQSISGNGSFNDVLFYYSSYNEFEFTGINSAESISSQENRSELNEIGFKTSKNWNIGNHFKYKVGANGLYRSILPPYKITVENGDNNEITNSTKEHQKELAAFASANYTAKKINLQFGLRTSMFGEELSNYFSVEPRLSALYHINNDFSIKAGQCEIHNLFLPCQKVFRECPVIRGYQQPEI